jgi:two-component system, cell cycle response regulator DivK
MVAISLPPTADRLTLDCISSIHNRLRGNAGMRESGHFCTWPSPCSVYTFTLGWPDSSIAVKTDVSAKEEDVVPFRIVLMGDAQMPLVLVVEDYQDTREMYAAYLQFSGFRVAEAANGLEALDKTRELLPDIILMDLALPKMDGWEATRRLKADERTAHIPIVALTGHALAGHAEGARQAGCDSFVTKPCLPDALVAEIQRMLSARRSAPDTLGSARISGGPQS